jgi:hypothetical protein
MEIIKFMNQSEQSHKYYCFLSHWSHGTNIVAIFLYDYFLLMIKISKRNNINRLKELSIEIDNCAKKEKIW